MLFEEDYPELEREIGKFLETRPMTVKSMPCLTANEIMKFIKARCEKNFAEYDIKITKKAQ